jgi:hypothetical protein
VAALDSAPSGLYDVVDDEPIRQRQLKTALAAAVGRRRLLSIPSWLLRIMAGSTGEALTRSLRVSNRRFRDATGWSPAVRNAVEGLGMFASASIPTGSQHVPAIVRVGLWLMALFTLMAGIQQQYAPRSFYDNFPGLGMQWVAVDGPYNEHLLRDLGGANLALGVVILFAIARPTIGLVRAIATAVLVAQVPHFVYHAAHLDALSTTVDRVLQTGALALTLVVPLLVLVASRDIGQQPRSRVTPSARAPRIGGSHPELITSSR